MTENILSPVIRAAENAIRQEPGDYTENGLLMCGKCHGKKETILHIPGMAERKIPCLCACGVAARDAEAEKRRKQAEMDKLNRLRSVGIANQRFRDATFAADDGKNEKAMRKIRRYADQWETMQQENIGLLLYGGVGTGKSYAAACIANYLIDRLIPVFMTNFASIMNTLGGLYSDDKNQYIADIMKYPLLILDDFGMERDTEYALEQVYNVIDGRYRSGRPLIVTTNLGLLELKNPPDMAHRRIYDRVLEMCVPLGFGDDGRRAGYAQEKRNRAVELLAGGDNP